MHRSWLCGLGVTEPDRSACGFPVKWALIQLPTTDVSEEAMLARPRRALPVSFCEAVLFGLKSPVTLNCRTPVLLRHSMRVCPTHAHSL